MIYKLLKDYVGMDEALADEYFNISETETEWVLTARGWLEIKTYSEMRRLVEDYGGSYEKGSKTKNAVFTVPKPKDAVSKPSEEPQGMDSEAIYKEPRNEIQTETSEGDYALSRSMKGKLGQLVPCLKDAEGNVFDGFHRIKINPSAWTVKLDHVKTASDRALARMTVNFCRRHYTVEEMTNDIGLLIGSGLTVQQISEATGISERTVYRYMPPQLKDQKISQATSEAKTLQTSTLPAVTPPLKTQDTVLCANCHAIKTYHNS